MSTPFIASIIMFGGNFAPRGWAFCNGQLLSIAQNTALFSILGTTYGGNGQTTFALPDLRGRVPLHHGQGPGLSSYSLGQQAGSETETLTTNQMPAHQHSFTIVANNAEGGQTKAAGRYLGKSDAAIYAPTTDNTAMGAQPPTSIVGGNQPFEIVQPYLCVSFIIALEGIFPSRN